ncbi:MAG: cobyric acid synthase [Desulfobacteraceae bacterium]|nr:cobyric acid synthase [Desulfobacteraceae bacterium]
MKKAKCLAVLGTGSDVGKSVVSTALCRCLSDDGYSVAPFKAQNMSNNSGVTPEGLEMGRAQIVQAEACRLAPHVDMNPVLLKPTSEMGSQVVLLGEVVGSTGAADRRRRRDGYFPEAAAALERIRAICDAVVMEGAGSCAEVNLMDRDIVNLRMAAHADAPAILVADIHRGGVFAQIVGTLACLPKPQQERIRGFIINRFRGDIQLFEEGVRWIEKRTGRPVFGVIPWYEDIRIEPEDSVVIESPRHPRQPPSAGKPAVAVIRLPHISNFNDFDPLLAVEGLEVLFVERPQDLSGYRSVILPGSKNTRWDLQWLHTTGWTEKLRCHARGGGSILGVCGGYQMLGRRVRDPQGLEGRPGDTEGLGLLPVETELRAPKTTTVTRFSWGKAVGLGYEIHMGQTLRTGGTPMFAVTSRNGLSADDTDGAVDADGRISGTYIHGLFDAPGVLSRWLGKIGLGELAVPEIGGLEARNRQYDRLAAHFRRYVDVGSLEALLFRDRKE